MFQGLSRPVVICFALQHQPPTWIWSGFKMETSETKADDATSERLTVCDKMSTDLNGSSDTDDINTESDDVSTETDDSIYAPDGGWGLDGDGGEFHGGFHSGRHRDKLRTSAAGATHDVRCQCVADFLPARHHCRHVSLVRSVRSWLSSFSLSLDTHLSHSAFCFVFSFVFVWLWPPPPPTPHTQNTHTPPMLFFLFSYSFLPLSPCPWSPWYNRIGWLGAKHQFTYLLTLPLSFSLLICSFFFSTVDIANSLSFD